MNKRAFRLFLQENLEFKRRVYEKSMHLAGRELPPLYEPRLIYEQEEIEAMLEFVMENEIGPIRPDIEGIWYGDTLIHQANIGENWHLLEKSLFKHRMLTWMEFIFGPVFPLFRNHELNTFAMEFYEKEREDIFKLFLEKGEYWAYVWMYYYRDVQKYPHMFEDKYEFPRLPRKLPRCLGHLSDCPNYSHHFCDECKEKFRLSICTNKNTINGKLPLVR